MTSTTKYRPLIPGCNVMAKSDGPDREINIARDRRFKVDGYPTWRSFMLEHPDGIYIDLPFLDYLNDWALSYSAFKELNSSPADWWWNSPFNVLEDQVQRSTPALRFGSALHCGLLEPEGELERRFGVKPSEDMPEYRDYARTIPDLKKAIMDLGNKPKGPNKPDYINELLELDPNAKILDLAIDDWRRKGFTELTADQFTLLRLMMRMAQLHPHLKNAFTGRGLSEVTVIWTDEDDIRQRARFDRLKPKASIDLKSFSNWKGREFKQALLREAALREYPMQAAHYDEGRRQARRLLDEGKIYFCSEVVLTDAEIEAINAERLAENPDEKDLLEIGSKRTAFRAPTEDELALVREVMGSEEWEWVWVFYKTDGAPTAQPVRLNRDNLAFSVGQEHRRAALSHFIHQREMNGLEPGKMWLRLEPMWTPENEDWPAFMDTSIS